jgi:hypothetical protein
MSLPIFFCDPHDHGKQKRSQPDYANCAIRVTEYEFDPNAIPHRMQIELTATCRGEGTIDGVNVTLYAVAGQLPLESHHEEELASLLLRNVISEAPPIQRWIGQTIRCSPDARPGWKTPRPIEWGTYSDPRDGYIILATLDIPEHPNKPRIQPREHNPARDLLVAVHYSKHGGSCEPKRSG